MAIYNTNKANVSQNHTKDCSRLSNEDDDMLSREPTICKQHQIQESWLNIIGLTGPQPAIWSESSSCHLNLRKIALNSGFPQILHSSML